jgi:anti-anti-sigma factor
MAHEYLLRPKGALDTAAGPLALETWRREIDLLSPTQVVLDLADVPHMDTAGLAAVIALRNRINKYGGAFVLRGASETHMGLLRLTGLATLFPDADLPLN